MISDNNINAAAPLPPTVTTQIQMKKLSLIVISSMALLAIADPDPSSVSSFVTTTIITTTIQLSMAMTMASPTDLTYVLTFVSSQEQVVVAALPLSNPMTVSSSVPTLSPAPTFFVKEPVPSSSPMMLSFSSHHSAISLTGSTSSSPTKLTTQSSTFSSPMTSLSMPSYELHHLNIRNNICSNRLLL